MVWTHPMACKDRYISFIVELDDTSRLYVHFDGTTDVRVETTDWFSSSHWLLLGSSSFEEEESR